MAINRDYHAERQTCEENKHLGEEREKTDIAVREKCEHLASKYTECEAALRGVLETVLLRLGGPNSIVALEVTCRKFPRNVEHSR